MLMEIRTIAAETRGIEYLQDHYDEFFVPIKATQELRTFDLPKSIWRVMFLAYAVFFLGITVATGRDRSALFMIVISASYVFWNGYRNECCWRTRQASDRAG
jgi:hypothetical protein